MLRSKFLDLDTPYGLDMGARQSTIPANFDVFATAADDDDQSRPKTKKYLRLLFPIAQEKLLAYIKILVQDG